MAETQTTGYDIATLYARNLAPFVEAKEMPPFDQFLHVNKLGSYLENPDVAAQMQQRNYGTPADPYAGAYEYEDRLADAALDRLDELAKDGQTFLACELARGISELPLATVFDSRPGRRAVTGEDAHSPNHPGRKTPHEAVEDKAFAGFTRLLHEGRGVPLHLLQNDEAYNTYRRHGNVYNAQGRLWQLAYELPEAELDSLLHDHTFRMHAFGEITRSAVSAEFYEQFTDQRLIDYKDIREAGLQYAAVRIAPGVVGFFEETGRLVESFDVTQSGKEAAPLNLEQLVAEALPNAAEDEREKAATVFRELSGNLQTRFIIEQSTGLSLNEYGIKDQILIDALLVRATPEQMRGIVASGKECILQAAQALEFGDDLGDSVLAIAERAESGLAREVFGMVTRYREYAAAFGNMFRAYDPAFADAATKAMAERLTDGIAALEVLVNRGRLRVDLGVGGTYAADLNEGMEALRLAERALQIQHDVLADPSMEATRAVGWNGQFAMYRLASEYHGEVLLYVRPEGGKNYDRTLEYGSGRGVEASISFITNPLHPHHLRLDKDPDGVSFRFDREGRRVDESPFAQNRDPTRPDGAISVDVSSLMGDPNTSAVRIGRLFAAGNALRSSRAGRPKSLHHNTGFFDQTVYGGSEGFKGLAEYTVAMAEAAVLMRRHKRTGRTALRQRVARTADQALAA